MSRAAFEAHRRLAMKEWSAERRKRKRKAAREEIKLMAAAKRCPSCNAPLTQRDTIACLRCGQSLFNDGSDTHPCKAPGCREQISNRYKLTTCAKHSLEGAREERDRLAKEKAIAARANAKHLRRVGRRTQFTKEEVVARKTTTEEAVEATPPTDMEVAQPEAAPTPGAEAPIEETTVKTNKKQSRKAAVNTTTKRAASKSGSKAKTTRAPKAKANEAKSTSGNVRLTDPEVRAFCDTYLGKHADATSGDTLRALRDSGKSASGGRFRPLFNAAKKAAARSSK